MTKTYDIDEWDREEYVQAAHAEAGEALECVRQAQRRDGDWLAALEVAEEKLVTLRERLALRLSDVLTDEED